MAETTIRIERRQGFTVLQNGMLRDPRLSLKAKGLLAMLLGLPDNWQFSVSGLAKICGTGKDAIRSALAEMEGAGYLDREQAHARGGKFGGNVYVVHEVSRLPLSENPTTVEECGQPLSGKPSTDKPSTENPTQLNKQEVKKDLNNPPVPPKRGKPARKPRDKSSPAWKPDRFEGFWKLYPCGRDRVGAAREWDRLKPSDELIAQMGRALIRQLHSPLWREGKGIPYACRWLRNRRWEDEDKPLPSGGPGGVPADPPLTPERFGWD